MTVNYSFDLEDDDFLDATFRSIPENDLLSYSISSPSPKSSSNCIELNNIPDPNVSDTLEGSSYKTANTEQNKKNSLSFLVEGKEIVKGKQKISQISSPNDSLNNIAETTKINSRFLPGFTPKAKKRKLPGPAGLFSTDNDQHFHAADSEHLAIKGTTAVVEIQNITNSQFSSEELLLPAWQNLQAEVSSCQNLLSTAKYYSIRRVLHETSKKKLPKHIVVPVLCVLIKKFDLEESVFVFMDDTGEMSGKIDKEVLDAYKDVIRENTALILKKVTCICNILFLKKQNVISIYLDDGSVKQVQDLNLLLDKEEPLKPMHCQCPGTPNEPMVKKPSLPNVWNSTPISCKKTLNAKNLSHKTTKKVLTESPSSSFQNVKENSYSTENTYSLLSPQIPIEKEKVLDILGAMLDVSKRDGSSGIIVSTSSLNPTTVDALKAVSNVTNDNSVSCSTGGMDWNSTSKTLNKKNSLNSMKQNPDIANNPSSFEEDLFYEDSDGFDQILCSLDENSFHKEL